MTAAQRTTGSHLAASDEPATNADGSLAAQTGERKGNPVQLRDGPAAVRGDASRRHATGLRAGKAARGEPRVRRPAARRRSEPLAEGGFVLRRPLVPVLAALLLLVVPGTALAARVTIRVEGKTQTIFAPAPRTTDAANALEALDDASLAGEFYYHLTQSSFGPYVDQVGRYGASASSGWVFKVNGTSPPVGADKVELHDGDVVLWYYADFGPTGGPPTLDLQRRAGGCYQAFRQDDTGARTAATGAVLRVDGRSVATKAGRACVKGKHGLVRAILDGAVRSNALA